MYAVLLVEQHIVVVIQSVYVISQCGVLWHKVQFYAILLHRGFCTQSEGEVVLFIKQSHTSHYAML